MAEIFGDDALHHPPTPAMYHLRCFKGPEQKYISNVRAERTLGKMITKADNAKSRRLREGAEKPRAQSEPVVFVDRYIRSSSSFCVQ